jgi:hypothetical protein
MGSTGTITFVTVTETTSPISTYTTTLNLSDGNNLNIVLSKETRSYYDFEIDTNDSKRTIELLKPEFVYPLDQEIKRLSSGTSTN